MEKCSHDQGNKLNRTQTRLPLLSSTLSSVRPEQFGPELTAEGLTAEGRPKGAGAMAGRFSQIYTDNIIIGYTSVNIKQDFLDNGRSLIMEKIVEAKKLGGCDCVTRNPKGG